MCVRMYLCMHLCMHVCVENKYVRLDDKGEIIEASYVRVSVCIYVCIYVCMYV
jgi:hypothetical protein